MAQIKFLIIVLFSITIQSQEFDFSCNTELDRYVDEWFAESESRGNTYSNRGIIKWVYQAPSHHHFQETSFTGVSVASCYEGYEIYIRKSWWDELNRTDADKKRVIYHEMGHAILNYGHVCNLPLPNNLQSSRADCFTDPRGTGDPINWIWNDIMRTSENCPDYNRCTNPTIDNNRYDRYWTGTDQLPLSCTNTNTSKGIDIIYD